MSSILSIATRQSRTYTFWLHSMKTLPPLTGASIFRCLDMLLWRHDWYNPYHMLLRRAVEFKFLAWSSIAQSVCQQAFGLLANRCLRSPGFESCSQQRKTTSLLSIRKSLACARASKLTTTNTYIARARCECQMAVGSGGLNACWS